MPSLASLANLPHKNLILRTRARSAVIAKTPVPKMRLLSELPENTMRLWERASYGNRNL